MAAGDIKIQYAASANLTVTNLAGIASSATWVVGWTSAYIDNSSNLYMDYLITGQFTVESAGLSAGEIRVYVYTELDDATVMDLFSSGTEGTEGTATITDTEIRDSGFVLARAILTDTTASRVYGFRAFSVASLFGGICPRKFAIFVAQSTGTTLETTGQQITQKGVFYNVAA